ncbi:ninein [Megalops cyprinoides]|uniref:ninein n=1 Tax=Megalops cyprinoides TaxID=118141 RepID=UPI001863AFEB|nr:ninein [Megalops cyprinoides]
MDEAQQDQYEQQLKEVFQSFDTSGLGSLCQEELSQLCQTLHLEEATPALLQTLLQTQDSLTARVDFEQFKDALIHVLSTVGGPSPSQDTTPQPESPEVRPKFVKDGKRYGRRSIPEFSDSITGFSEVTDTEPAGDNPEEAENTTVPRKRERWNTHADGTEEYEAEGQLHLWNPDDPGTPRGPVLPLSDRLEERLRGACEDLAVSWDGCASRRELLSVCEHLGLEVTEDAFQRLDSDGVMSVQEFMSWVLEHCKPPTPSASTPYRQLKRHHSTQPFDETGRRIATPSAMTSTIGLRLFSDLDDGTGFTPVEYLLDAWLDDGIENSPEILQALDFNLDGKVNLSELTVALENELLITKNGIYQAALASFKAEIRHLMGRVDRELREKEKIRSDLEKAEKLKTQMATEVDEHNSALERMNDLNLRKLEQDHREKLAAVRAELTKEMDLIQQQANQQREELESEMEKIKEDEAFLREHLSLTVKENGRLEAELLESTEKLVEAENMVSKLQRNLDSILKDKFGDLDPGSAEFFLQEERLRQLRTDYEGQCRELQDRIDELQAELEEYHTLGRAPNLSLKPSLSEEFDTKSPGIESDQGLGSEECQPFNMTLEAEMMMEQLKERHLQEVESLRTQLENQVSEYHQKIEEQRAAHEEQQRALSLRCQEEVQALQEEMSRVQDRVQVLQNQLDQVQLERVRLEQSQAQEWAELVRRHEEEMSSVRQELLEARAHIGELEQQLTTLELQQARNEQSLAEEREKLGRLQGEERSKMEEHHKEVLQVRLEEERARLQAEREEVVKRLVDEWEREKDKLQESHEALLQAKLEEERQRYLGECEEQERMLIEEWEKEKVQLKEQQDSIHQVLLEEEKLRLLKEQEEVERKFMEHYEKERAQFEESQENVLQARLTEERERLQNEIEKRLMQDWQRERAQLEDHHEVVLQARLREERERLLREKEVQEKKLIEEMEKERAELEENHREAIQELSAKHSVERERLSSLLDKLREDIAEERKELEMHFSQRIRDVETRFSGDQEAVSERFQTDVCKLEQQYQSELHNLSERHAEEKAKWKSEMEEVTQAAEEEKRALRDVLQQEKDSITQELVKERQLLEQAHKKEFDALAAKNKELQNELESFISAAQIKEIELSRQLNELHSRLQESLDAKDELLARSEKKALELELLLRQAVEDFEQEKAELQGNMDELEERNKKTLSLAEKQEDERENLLAENNQLKSKIQEMEAGISQLAELRKKFEEMRMEKEESGMVISSLQSQIEELKSEMERLTSLRQEQEVRVENVVASEACDEMIATQGDSLILVEPLLQKKKEDANNDKAAFIQQRMCHREKDAAMMPKLQAECKETAREQDLSFCKITEPQDKVDGLQAQACLLAELHAQYDATNEKNMALQQEIIQLQQRTRELEFILEDNYKKIAAGEQAIEDNISLRDDLLAMVEHTKKMEVKISEMMNLQIKYEECLSENSRLGEQNKQLEDRLLDLESKMHIIQDYQEQHVELQNEIIRMKKENCKLSTKVRDLQKQDEVLLNLQQEAEVALTEAMAEETLQDLNSQLEAKIQAVSDLEDCCTEFEWQNAKLRRALSGLQEKSLKIHEKMQAHRSEAVRLAEENLVLRHKISTLKEEDLRETQEEMLHKIEQYRKERLAAQKLAENLKKQVLELQVRGQQLEDENGLLTQTSSQNSAYVQELSHHLSELLRHGDRKDGSRCQQQGELERANLTQPAQERSKMEACVLTLEMELAKAQGGNSLLEKEKAQLIQQLSSLREQVLECQLSHLLQDRQTMEKQNQAFRAQLSTAQEKVQAMDEALQAVNLQNARLKSDLRVIQQEKEALKQEVMSLHKQLQNANDKNQVLEMALHTSGYQNQHKKLYWDELARLVEQEQQLLRQENERLQREVQTTKGDLVHSRDKTRQLETIILSLKQQKQQGQSSLVKAVEQEKASLKRELDSLRKELVNANSKGQRELENLRQENEGLKNRQTRLEAQLLEALQAQLGGPQAQLRSPGERRGQHRGDELGGRGLEINLQEEQEAKMMEMEERMRDVELKLRNVKLLLQEKVSQLKDQVHKNTKADIMIKDLYVENAQLLKALEMTEQRQKVAEKKNYLLEEKISSLNKIVRDLSPSPLTAVPYHFTRS